MFKWNCIINMYLPADHFFRIIWFGWNLQKVFDDSDISESLSIQFWLLFSCPFQIFFYIELNTMQF